MQQVLDAIAVDDWGVVAAKGNPLETNSEFKSTNQSYRCCHHSSAVHDADDE
jgi:hypothetical protein